MRFNFFRRKMAHNSPLFTAQYIDPRALFVHYFGMLPNVSYITEVDVSQAYPFIRDRVGSEALDCFQHAQYNHDAGRIKFNMSYILLAGGRLIEAGSDYIAILHGRDAGEWAAALLRDIASFRVVDNTDRRIGFATRQELSN